MASSPLRVALLNDYDLVVDGLAGMHAPFDDIEVVQKAVGEMELDEPVDVALFDTYGRATACRGTTCGPLVASEGARHVALFTFTLGPELVRRALGEGLSACLWKGMARGELADTCGASPRASRSSPARDRGPVRPTATGGPSRSCGSRPARAVLALLAEGMTNRAIAEAMGLGRETVKSHVREVFLKLGVHTRSEATNRVLRDPAFSHRPRHLVYRRSEGGTGRERGGPPATTSCGGSRPRPVGRGRPGRGRGARPLLQPGLGRRRGLDLGWLA